MTKFMYSIATILAVAACSKEELNQPKPVNEESGEIVPTVITAYTDKDVVKTALEGNSIVWKTTDNVLAWSATAAYKSISTVISDEGRKAQFVFDTQDELLYLAYPAETATTCENGAFATYIPTSQKAVEDGFADGVNFAVGKLKGTETLMKNVGALMCVEVKDENITSIRLSATGVAGASSATMDGENISAVGAGDANSIRLGGTIQKDKSYYFVVYPGNYSSLQLRFANSLGKIATLTNNQGLTLERNGNTVIYKAEVPAAKWVDGIDIDEYKGTSIKPGTADNLCLKVEGTYLDGDKVYVSYDGAGAEELDAKYYSLTDSKLSIYTPLDKVGRKVRYFLSRGGVNYSITANIDVAQPAVADGYIPDAVLRSRLKACNKDVASCFDVCDMVLLDKAASVNPFENEKTTYLDMGSQKYESLEGLELFSAWSGTSWTNSDIRMWLCGKLTDADLSKWTAKVGIRLGKCNALKRVVYGPNMHGGIVGGTSYETVSAFGSKNLSYLNIEDPVPALKLLDLRTYVNICGAGMTLTQLANVTNPTGLTIRMTEEFYKTHTYADAWQNGIYAAWKKGAVVEVYDNDELNTKLGTCPSYASNPNALPAGEKYIEGTNWDCGGVKYACESYDVAIAEANKAYARYTEWKGSDETVIFPIVTDIHATGVSGNKQFREVAYTDEVFHYDFIAHLGDIATANKLTKAIIDNTAAQQNNYNGIVIFTPGNHDWDNDWNDPDNKYHISATKMSETFQVPSMSRPGGENIHIVNGKCYGYYDIPSKKFRIFFLDSFGNTESGTSIRWNDVQLQWLMGELAKTPEGYSIVFISHVMPHDSGKWASNIWPPEWKTPSYRIRPMLEDFINRRNGQDGNVSWNFTSAQGKIAGFITGDTHVDWLGKEDGLNLFISQGAGFMSDKEMKPEHKYESFDWTTDGTFFTHVIAIKPGKSEVKAFRIGAAGDASYDYEWTY